MLLIGFKTYTCLRKSVGFRSAVIKNSFKRWNNGEIAVLLAHPAAASFGLNLQHGGHITIWYSIPWSLEHYIQFNARLLRSGQQASSVIIHHIIAEGTIDNRVMEVLEEKDASQEAIIRATLWQRD